MKISENGAPIQSGRGIESVRQQIEAAFAPIRERRCRQNSATNLGRRKDDWPQIDAVVLRYNQMIADAANPEVELVEPEPLTKQAAPLLALIGNPVVRKKAVRCHEINEVFEGDVQKLFDEAEAALGFRKAPDADSLRTCLKAESNWRKDIFRRAR